MLSRRAHKNSDVLQEVRKNMLLCWEIKPTHSDDFNKVSNWSLLISRGLQMNDMTKDMREKTVTVLLCLMVELVLKKRNCCGSLCHQGFPFGSAGEESACDAGNLGSIPGLGRSPGEGKGYHSSILAWRTAWDCIVHGVTKSQTWLSHFHFHCVIKARKLVFCERCGWTIHVR